MRIRKKSLSEAILFSLEVVVDGYVALEDFLYNPGLHVYGMREVPKSQLSQALKRLRERGLVETSVSEEKILLKLSRAGKDSIRFNKIINLPWDGKWRIVIFDIPETHKAVRNLFRRRLRDWEFRIFQKSVWISKLDVTSELRKFIKELEIDKWVSVIESNDPALNNIT